MTKKSPEKQASISAPAQISATNSLKTLIQIKDSSFEEVLAW